MGFVADEEGIDLPGIGPKLSSRLERKLGGHEGVLEVLDQGDVASLASVPGISRQRAVAMVQAHRGEDASWLRTGDAEALAREALEPFLERAVTSLGRAGLETLAPVRDEAAWRERLEASRAWSKRLEGEDLEAVVDALGDVRSPRDPRPSPEGDVTLFVEVGSSLHEDIMEEGLDAWVDVATSADRQGSGLLIAATMGHAPPGAVHVTPEAAYKAVPWRDVAWARANRDVLEALSRLAGLLDVEDHAFPVLEALDQAGDVDPVDLEDVAKACVEEANEVIEERIEEVTLSGHDVLEVLQGGKHQAVEELVHEARTSARKGFEDETGLAGAPLTHEYPLKVDPRELARLDDQQREDAALERFQAAQTIADAVQNHQDGIEAMVKQAFTLDQHQAIKQTQRAHELTYPKPGDRFTVKGALHLALEDGERVDYPVPNGVALLTGANSGGKTTLIETLAQTAYLAHLGLPVPAEHATLPLLDGLAYYERPRQLGAGAFEGFLTTIQDVLLTDENVLVLADELEAMTELEAASAILAEVVTRLDARDAPAVLVTHLAPYILEHVTARTDGIQAKGLDEDDELMVDRTPRIGTVARSTPELILQRLRNRSKPPQRDLYASMLERLHDNED